MTEGKEKAYLKLKTARGQIDGILKMMEEDRYCIDISTQILSVIGLLKKSNTDILSSHLKTCVKNSMETGDEDEKLDEIINILNKLQK